ncbi:phage terminase large subunit family protein, partial [Caulobacter sp. HMWF025]|uniref:phage terminase large subunit family protein n=1 Tax=Caulobacter sp. HMWF025 TaxID=2056860 RepID=UPI003FA40531
RLERRAFVLADHSAAGLSPHGWARKAVAAARAFGAHALVAEANQGGDMVRAVLAQADPPCPVKLVRATQGKRARAEPVAALYEQGRVIHCGAFAALEEELMALGTGDLSHSPDRADALVWAVSELMLGVGQSPRVRGL